MTTGQRTDHLLDAVIDLRSDGGRGAYGRTLPECGNVVGPFGGATAALILRAIEAQADRVGEPVALTVAYAAPIADGEFRVDVDLVRTNRTNQHWTAALSQDGEVKSTATAVFEIRREIWSDTEAVMPTAREPTYFHARADELERVGDDYVLTTARAQRFAGGYSTRPRNCGRATVRCWPPPIRLSITRIRADGVR